MLEVRLLGQFEVRCDGKQITIPTRNAQTLFAYLVLNAGRAHRREKLAGLLWSESSEENARSNLRHEIWRLRKAFGPAAETCFQIDDLAVSFNVSDDTWLDVVELENAAPEGNTPDPLMKALSVYGGELLPGFYQEWVSVERERLQSVFETRMGRLLAILQAEERWQEIIEWGMRWISLSQWPEPAYQALMNAHARSGDLSKAAAVYERFEQGVQKELGIKPSTQTQAIYQRVKSGGKDFDQAAVHSQDPQPVKAAPAYALPRVRRSNLPKPLTSFIGRENEIQAVEDLVTKARLVTIAGSGGVGKTRLAIQTADALAARFQDGVCWVELAAISEDHLLQARPPTSELDAAYPRGLQIPREGSAEPLGGNRVSQAVAKALRLPQTSNLPLIEELVEHLQDKKLLLVLDNCEHLIESCAILAERLLSDCPEVTILTTSREALGVPGEKAWRLPSLSLPEPGNNSGISGIFQSEAVSLFVERAKDVNPGYQPGEDDAALIAQICRRLSGIPLAIELAAARMNLLSAQEIAARLDRRFNLLTGGHRTAMPRHQTLWSAIEWSHDLLTPLEQVLFRRMSVFSGSFSIKAAEAVCASQEIGGDDVLPLLGRLVDKSLLHVEPAAQELPYETRYRYLDTIQNFGRLKLDGAEETRWMRDRHADYYVRLVETAEPELNLPNSWYRLLLAENDNLRAVVEWGVESDQAESALRLIGALLWFWLRSGAHREGVELSRKVLAAPSAQQPTRFRARALNTVGYMQCLLGDMVQARQSLEEALAILKNTDDEASLAWSLQFQGLVLAYDGEYDLAEAASQEGLALTRKLVDINANSLLFFVGDIDLIRGDTARAKKIYLESVSILRGTGNKSFLAYPLRRLGYLALDQNDIPGAWKYFQESLVLNHEVGDVPGFTGSLASMAALAIRLNQPEAAARLYGAIEKLLFSLSVNLLFTDQAAYARTLNQLPDCLEEQAFTDAFHEGWKMDGEQAIRLVEEMLVESPVLASNPARLDP